MVGLNSLGCFPNKLWWALHMSLNLSGGLAYEPSKLGVSCEDG